MLFYDQLQRFRSPAAVATAPHRIAGAFGKTELLHDLGLEEEVVGITKFCVHPAEWLAQKTRVGGTKTLDIQKIAALQPDLLLGNKRGERPGADRTAGRPLPIWMSNVSTLADALDMILRVGSLTDRAVAARQSLGADIRQAFEVLEQGPPRPRIAYFIWRKPYMVAAADTFIHSMLTCAGFDNVFAPPAAAATRKSRSMNWRLPNRK